MTEAEHIQTAALASELLHHGDVPDMRHAYGDVPTARAIAVAGLVALQMLEATSDDLKAELLPIAEDVIAAMHLAAASIEASAAPTIRSPPGADRSKAGR